MSETAEERVQKLVHLVWSILAGMFFVVLFGVLFVIHLQLDRIEANALIDDSYRSTIEALE